MLDVKWGRVKCDSELWPDVKACLGMHEEKSNDVKGVQRGRVRGREGVERKKTK
jgi:hypothetical protein